MSTSDVTRQGLRGVRAGREAAPGRPARRPARGGEREMVPSAEFTSYYGKPVINSPVWHSPDIPGYFFLGHAESLYQVTDQFRLVHLPGTTTYLKGLPGSEGNPTP